MLIISHADQLAISHAARRRQIAFQCATEMLAYARANNRPDLVKEATDILDTLNKGMS